MQKKRRLLKRLLKEVLDESKNKRSIKEIYTLRDEPRAFELLKKELVKHGYKQFADKINPMPKEYYSIFADLYIIPFFDKKDIVIRTFKDDLFFNNMKTGEVGYLKWGKNDFVIERKVNGQIIPTKDNFMDFKNFTSKPKIVKDKYWGMKALKVTFNMVESELGKTIPMYFIILYK